MDAACCAAIDLGASNGRVVVARLEGERLTLLEAARFETPSFQDASGYQCWDVDRLEGSVREGLAAAQSAAPLASVGVDTWGVDYALLDGDGRRTAPVVAYRDARTQASMRETLARMPQAELYRRTGIQLQPFNTVFQLAATSAREPAWLARARRLLFLPDYFHHRLGGAQANEYTEATTSALLALETRDWDGELLRLVGVGGSLLSRPVEPGTPLGFLDLGDGGARRTRVIAPATHDTASSVAAIPLEGPGTAYISSGTWSLMGIESPVPLADERALRLNVTNEGGVGRTYRVLKNIVGLWLVQRSCRSSGAGTTPRWWRRPKRRSPGAPSSTRRTRASSRRPPWSRRSAASASRPASPCRATPAPWPAAPSTAWRSPTGGSPAIWARSAAGRWSGSTSWAAAPGTGS